jgi:hypothetical protein
MRQTWKKNSLFLNTSKLSKPEKNKPALTRRLVHSLCCTRKIYYSDFDHLRNSPGHGCKRKYKPESCSNLVKNKRNERKVNAPSCKNPL